MARNDDLKIKIQAEFEDNTIGGIKKAEGNLKQFEKKIQGSTKAVQDLDGQKAEPIISCRDELTKEIEKTQKQLTTLDSESVDAEISLKDRASAGVDQAVGKVRDFSKLDSTATIGVNDKASAKMESIAEAGFDFSNHPFNATVGIIDKATTVMENIDGRAKTLAAKAINITIGAIDKATEPLRNVYNWLTSIQGMVTTLAAGEGFKNLFVEPVKTADFFATSQIGFETMLGSEQAAIDMMDKINKFAIETPFNTSSLVETTQRMIAMGWAADTVIEDLDTIGDAMAAMGKGEEGVSAVTLALSQMRAAGKVNAQDMMQLVNVGLPAWQYLADGMGKTVAEVREMASAGQITANDAIPKILQGMQQFDGMMDRTANETVSGLFSQLQDIAEINIVKPWGKGLSEGVRPALTEINNILGEVLGNGESVGSTLEGWGKSLGGTVATGLSTFVKNILNVVNNPEFNSMTWAEKTSMLLEEGIVKPISAWWDKSGKVETTKLAKNMMTALGNGVKELLPVVLEAAFSNPVTGTLVASWGLKTGTNFLGGIMSGLAGAKTAVSNTIGVLKGISNIKNIGGFGNFANTVKEAGSLTEALKKIGEASKVTTSGISTLSDSTELISDVFGKAYKETGSLTSAMKMANQTTEALSSGAITASTSTGGLISSLGSIAPIAGTVAAAVGAVGLSYLHYKNMVNGARESIQQYLTESDNLITKNQELNSNILQNIQNRQQDMASVSANSEVARQYIDLLFQQIDAQQQTAQSQELIKSYVDGLNQTMPQLGLNYDSVTNKLYDQNGALYENKQALEGRIQALQQEAMQEAARSQLVEAYKDQINAQLQQKELEQEIKDLEAQRVEQYQKLTEAQNNNAVGSAAYNQATQEAGIAVRELNNQISSVRGELDNTNATLGKSQEQINNLTEIASGQGEQIVNAANTTASGVNAAADSTTNHLGEAGSQAGQNYSTGLSSQEEAVRSSAEQTLGYVGSKADSIKNDMSAKGSDAGSNWMSGFKSAFSNIGDWFNDLFSGFNAQIDTVKNRTSEYEAKNPKKHAQGGILSTPHLGLVAEDGPEAIIPLSGNKKDRGLELWEEAGKRLGVRTYAEGGITPGSTQSQESKEQSASTSVGFNIAVSDTLDSDYSDAITKTNEFAATVNNTNQQMAMNAGSWWTLLGNEITSQVGLYSENFNNLAMLIAGTSTNLLTTINNNNGSVQGSFLSLFDNLNVADGNFNTTFQAFLSQIYTSGTSTFNQFASETSMTFNNLINTIAVPLSTIQTSFITFQNNLVVTGLQTFTEYVNNARVKLAEAEVAVTTSLQNMINSLESKKSEFYNKGSELMGQIKAGMDSRRAELANGMLELADAIKQKFEEGMGIASPSKWGIWAGSMIPEGLIKGMSGDKLARFVTHMVSEVQTAWDEGHFDANKLVNYLSEDTVISLMGRLTGLDTSAIAEQQIAYPLIGTRGVQTSWFGPRESPGGIGSTNHGGVDLAAPTGTGIASALAGSVTTASWYGGYGNAVVVDSGDIDIIYGHMSKIGAAVGQQVGKGQKIGEVGSTGNSTGPHLHFEMHQNGQKINPQPYIDGASILVSGGNPLVAAIQNALNLKKGIATVGSALGNVAYNPSAGVEQWRSTVIQALQMLGQPLSEVDNILYIIDKESSGNPNPPDCLDYNYYHGYPSKGLMQTIPQTFAAYRNPSLSDNILDPLANIYAGINYMIQRYGSIAQTIAQRRGANGRWNGYAQGTPSATEGFHWVGERGKELVYFGGGETVFPNKESKQIEDIAEGTTTTSNSSKQVVFNNGAITFNITANGNSSGEMFNSFVSQVEANVESIAGILAEKLADTAEGTPINGVFA